jgi:hypothetical protein
MKVNFCDDEHLEPACIDVKPDGLVLNFNSDDGSGTNKRGESVPLGEIVIVR